MTARGGDRPVSHDLDECPEDPSDGAYGYESLDEG